MYSSIEQPISSISKLRRLMKQLEEDEALRIEGALTNFRGGGYVFVGILGGKYQVNLCDKIRCRRANTYTVGKKNEWYQFADFEQAWRFLRPIIKSPLKAWTY